MKRLLPCLLPVLASLHVVACAGDDSDVMTHHDVCVRMSAAACDRQAICEPTVDADGCFTQLMATCCRDGVCDEPVVATEPRMRACEQAIASLSCSDLDDGDMPTSCDHLDDPLPVHTPPGDAGPQDSPTNPMTTGVLDLSWWIAADNTSISCETFYGATTLRLHVTDPNGTSTTRDFACNQYQAVTSLPVGVYSMRAELLAGTKVVQQTAATSVHLEASGATQSFQFAVTTQLGSFCQQLASSVCATCYPGDTSCVAQYYSECCGTDGTCSHAALAQPGAFDACINAYNSGQYCSSTPPQCSSVVTTW